MDIKDFDSHSFNQWPVRSEGFTIIFSSSHCLRLQSATALCPPSSEVFLRGLEPLLEPPSLPLTGANWIWNANLNDTETVSRTGKRQWKFERLCRGPKFVYSAKHKQMSAISTICCNFGIMDDQSLLYCLVLLTVFCCDNHLIKVQAVPAEGRLTSFMKRGT